MNNVNVAFERGRFTAVMGPSGSGKSTLMQCMARLDRPTSGQVFIGGQDIGRLDAAGVTRLRRDRPGVELAGGGVQGYAQFIPPTARRSRTAARPPSAKPSAPISVFRP